MFNPFAPSDTLFGMRIYESPLVPKKPRFQLAESVPVTQEFRDGFNHWAREFFGEDEQILVYQDTIFASPETMKLIRLKVQP
jgi:hypothetical protein